MSIWLLLSCLLNVFLCGCCIYLANELNTERIIYKITQEAIVSVLKTGCESCRYRKGGEINEGE